MKRKVLKVVGAILFIIALSLNGANIIGVDTNGANAIEQLNLMALAHDEGFDDPHDGCDAAVNYCQMIHIYNQSQDYWVYYYGVLN